MTSPYAGRRLWRALMGVAATGAFLAFAPTAMATPSAATPPYHVHGNQVLGANGKQFVPDGFVIDCAAFDEPVDTLCTGDDNQDPWTGETMLTAAAGFWHADVIRLQVSSEQLFPGQDTIDESYLKLIDSLVDEATALHLVTIVSLQTEYDKGPALPTAGAVRFWDFMTKNLGANHSVMFDLYNEPRLNTSSSLGEQRMWHLWEDGGTYDGVTYVGDQALVNTIRAEGAGNVIIAEGNKHDRDLTLLSSHYLTDPDGNIAYGIEPNLSQKHETEPEWGAYFGDLSKQVPIFPEAFLPRFQECNPAAATILPELFSYLDQIHMGLIVWTLLPGVTTQGDNLDDPTNFSAATAPTDPCLTKGTPVTRKTTYGEGAGILGFFVAQDLSVPGRD